MSIRTIAAATIALTAIPATAGTTVPSLSNPQPVASTTSDWHCRVAMYGWFMGLTGDMTVAGHSAPLKASFSDLLQQMDFAFMGAMEVGYGRWSFFTDLNYAALSANSSHNNVSVDMEMDQFLGNFFVSYAVLDQGPTQFAVYAGARVNSLSSDVQLDRGTVRAFNSSESKTWTDPVIGVQFQQDLSEQFFFRAVGDVGGFGVASDLTWQAFGAFGYRVNDRGNLLLGYRAIGTDYTDGGFTYDLTSLGPVLGFEYRF